MDKGVEKIVKDIKSLKIQGARNVAYASIDAIILTTNRSKAKTVTEFIREIYSTADSLSSSRPTEPMMRNLMDEAMKYCRSQNGSLKEVKGSLIMHEKAMKKSLDEGAKHLAEYGAKLIPDDALVLTHCHSSSSTMCMIEAKKMGKKFSVVSFETRPRYQGRTTAAELAKAGIDVTSTVDGAMNLFMKKADMVIVGADSVTSRGDLINKIGTSTLAHIARMNDVSFYSAAELFKYSPMTMYGTRERIEERDSREVWDKPPKGVKIRNPAFEATAAKYINGYITESGVIPPESFFSMAAQKLGIKL